MPDAVTEIADLFAPEVCEYYADYEWSDSLEMIDGMVGPDRSFPFPVGNFGSVAPLSAGGQFVQRPKFKRITGLASRNDITSVAALSSLKIQGRNDAGVLCNLKIGTVAITPSAENLSKARSGELQAFIARQGVLEARLLMQQYLISATVGVIGAVTAAAHTSPNYGAAAKTNMSPNILNSMRFLMRDMVGRISWWLMRSEAVQDLVGDNIGRSYSGVGDVILAGGRPTTFGLPFAMVDDSNLFLAGGGVAGFDEIFSVGVGPDFLDVNFTRPMQWYAPFQSLDYAQVVIKTRADLDFAVAANGFKWDQSKANPTAADLATTGNWTPQYTSHKEIHGVMASHNWSGS